MVYKVDLDYLKARLFDEIMNKYLDADKDGCPNYEWQIAMAVSVITSIQSYGTNVSDSPFIGGE